MDNNTETKHAAAECEVRPDVLNYDDIRQMAPRLDGHEKLVNWLLHFLSVDKVNDIHRRFCDTPGPEFVRRMLFDGFRIKLRIDGEEVLDNLPEGPFITVSNHPFGALDGIMLIYLISTHGRRKTPPSAPSASTASVRPCVSSPRVSRSDSSPPEP